MIDLWNRIKNIVKVGRLVSSTDSGNFTRGTASYMGKEVPVLIMKQYGHLSRPPANSMCLLLAQNGQESNAIAIVDDPKRRTLKDLVEGETALNNQETGDYIYLKDGNAIDVLTGTHTITTGNATATMTDGQIVLDVNGTNVTITDGLITLNGNTQINGTLTTSSTIQSGDTITSGDDVVTDAGISLDDHTHGAGSLVTPAGSPSGSTDTPS